MHVFLLVHVHVSLKSRRVIVVDLKQRLVQLQTKLDDDGNGSKVNGMLFDSMSKDLFHATKMLEPLVHSLVAVPDH